MFGSMAGATAAIIVRQLRSYIRYSRIYSYAYKRKYGNILTYLHSTNSKYKLKD